MAFRIRSPLNNDPALLPRNDSLVDVGMCAAYLSRPTQELKRAPHDSASVFHPFRSSPLPYSSLGGSARESLVAQTLDDHLKLARATTVQTAIAQEVVQQRYLNSVLVHRLQLLHFEARQNAHLTSFRAPTEEMLGSKAASVSSSKPPKGKGVFTELQLVQHLGSVLRKRSDPFIDCVGIKVDEKDESDPSTSKGRPRGESLTPPFPQHLHKMLSQVEKDGESDVVSFCPHGRAFKVHDMDRFVDEILPKHFRLSKWTSFRRQLNLYGFLRVRTGPDASAYYHVLFLQCRPDLAQHMKRVAVSDGKADRRWLSSKQAESGEDPNLYALPSACARNLHDKVA